MTTAFRLTPDSLKAIRRYAADRRNAATIARLMSCAPGTVENICRDHGIDLVTIADGEPPPKPYRTKDGSRVTAVTLEVPIASEAMELIRQEAIRRGVKPSTLVSRVSEIIAIDGMFKAVLDR